MSGNNVDCAGCVHTVRRFKASKPRLWCVRFHRIAPGKCIDYRTKPSAIKAALNWLRIAGGK